MLTGLLFVQTRPRSEGAITDLRNADRVSIIKNNVVCLVLMEEKSSLFVPTMLPSKTTRKIAFLTIKKTKTNNHHKTQLLC